MKEKDKDKLIELYLMINQLGTVEKAVLFELTKRLLDGQRKFGYLHKKKKVWSNEWYEEMLDGMVYAATALKLRETTHPNHLRAKYAPAKKEARKQASR